MAVDDAAVLGRNRYVGEESADEPGPDRDAAHRTDDRFAAIDDIVDDVARLLPLPGTRREIVDVLLDDREVAAGGKYPAGPRQDRGIDAGVLVDIAPDLGKLAMEDLVGRVHAAVLHRDAENRCMRPVEFEPPVAGIRVSHREPLRVCGLSRSRLSE